MRLYLTSMLAAVGGLLAVPAFGLYVPQENPPLLKNNYLDRDIVRETELYCFTLGIFFEGGSTAEPEVGQRHIARVIVERAKANRRIWGGSTICGVVFYERKGVCQFSFACLPLARRTPRIKGPLWYASEAIARDALEGRNEEPPQLIRYYMNVELTPLKNACLFRKEFVPVVKAGRHDFFREPSTAERKELARSNPEECQRYAQQLAAKKAAAKKLAAKKLAAKKLAAKKLKLKKLHAKVHSKKKPKSPKMARLKHSAR